MTAISLEFHFSTQGDPDLTALAGVTTRDKNVLEFDFTLTTGGDLFFSYAFASEEHNEAVNSSLNDVFALFINGVNIALIPGTNMPVSVNTINCGRASSGFLPGTNPSNCHLFKNNDLENDGPSL